MVRARRRRVVDAAVREIHDEIRRRELALREALAREIGEVVGRRRGVPRELARHDEVRPFVELLRLRPLRDRDDVGTRGEVLHERGVQPDHEVDVGEDLVLLPHGARLDRADGLERGGVRLVVFDELDLVEVETGVAGLHVPCGAFAERAGGRLDLVLGLVGAVPLDDRRRLRHGLRAPDRRRVAPHEVGVRGDRLDDLDAGRDEGRVPLRLDGSRELDEVQALAGEGPHGPPERHRPGRRRVQRARVQEDLVRVLEDLDCFRPKRERARPRGRDPPDGEGLVPRDERSSRRRDAPLRNRARDAHLDGPGFLAAAIARTEGRRGAEEEEEDQEEASGRCRRAQRHACRCLSHEASSRAAGDGAEPESQPIPGAPHSSMAPCEKSRKEKCRRGTGRAIPAGP